MKYIISDQNEKYYIGMDNQGRFTKRKDKSKAIKYDSYFKAENVIINNIKDKTANYKIIELIDLKESKNMIDYIEDKNEEEIEVCHNIKLDYDLKTVCEQLMRLPSEISNEKIRLNNLLIKTSRALTDISHYQEFNNKRSASHRCKLEILESKLLEKRRELKDNLYYIELIEARLNGEDIKYQEINENRLYQPRELNNLFTKNEIEDFDKWWEEINK